MSDLTMVELSKKYYHLRNLFNQLKIYTDQAIEELDGYDNDSAESIMDDFDILIEEAKANGFVD